MQPNPFVWDRDFAQMHDNGINMIRTGLWTAWDQVMKEPGVVQESALRNLEAFLMTARRYNIPVQFTFFAFIPDNFGGANPYLDPEAVRRQQDYITAIVSRFKDVPWLMWDLINEPSFDKTAHLWVTRANGDRFESQRWNDYLDQNARHRRRRRQRLEHDHAALTSARSRRAGFSPGSVYRGGHPLSAHDFYMFAQQQFVEWAQTMRQTIRATGSKQLITVGQDEGGGTDRLNTSYWVDAVDFTTNHSWWLNDALLWDSLVAKQPGKPLLIQETGLQNDFQIDDTWRRSPDNQAYTLERKCALALATSAGVIDWLWNVNAYMTEDVEVTIGIVRPDYTEKAETAVMRGLAKFRQHQSRSFSRARAAVSRHHPGAGFAVFAAESQRSCRPAESRARAAQLSACSGLCHRAKSARAPGTAQARHPALAPRARRRRLEAASCLCLTGWDIAHHRLVRPRSLLALHLAPERPGRRRAGAPA